MFVSLWPALDQCESSSAILVTLGELQKDIMVTIKSHNTDQLTNQHFVLHTPYLRLHQMASSFSNDRAWPRMTSRGYGVKI